jgi:hypothetical protein
MAVLIAQTLEELRASVGRQYGGLETHTATSAGSTSTFVDAELEATDDYINGRYFRATSGTNDGAIRIVDDYVGSTTTGTLRGDVLSATVADGDTYELWQRDLSPTHVDDAINRAIRNVPRKASPPLRDISLHTSTHQTTFTIPTATVGITEIQIRTGHTEKVLHNCDSVWDELVDGDTTATAELEDKREGSGSNKFVIAAGMSASDIIASVSISSTDLSKYTHVEFWFKSTVTLTAGQAKLILSSTANAGTETEALSVPAITADTWTFCRVALANPLSDTAIISLGLDYTADVGAAPYQIDGIRATKTDNEKWLTIHRRAITFDKDARQFTIDYSNAPAGAEYALLRVLGVKKPSELSADTDNCDVDPEYIINQATANLLRSRGDRRGGNRDAAMIEANDYEALAQAKFNRLPTPNGVIWIDD